MKDTIIYDDSDNQGVERIQEFIGGIFPPCPDCNGTGYIDDDYGGKDCVGCVSRLLPIPTQHGVQMIDWLDAISKTDTPGIFTIHKGPNW